MILTEQSVSFPRAKPRWPLLGVAYRIARVARLAFGERRMLRLMLNLHWITWRMGYELSYSVFGREFLNETHGVSTGVLARYVPAGGTVIDIGCGTGRLAHLVPSGTRFLGLDRDESRVAEAQAAFAAHPLVRFRAHDLTTTWPEDATGDVALLVGVLEHVEEADVLLRKLHAVAPMLMVEVPDMEADALTWSRHRLMCPWYTDADHVREYTRELLQAQLLRNDWVPVEWVQRGAMVLAICAARDASPSR